MILIGFFLLFLSGIFNISAFAGNNEKSLLPVGNTWGISLERRFINAGYGYWLNDVGYYPSVADFGNSKISITLHKTFKQGKIEFLMRPYGDVSNEDYSTQNSLYQSPYLTTSRKLYLETGLGIPLLSCNLSERRKFIVSYMFLLTPGFSKYELIYDSVSINQYKTFSEDSYVLGLVQSVRVLYPLNSFCYLSAEVGFGIASTKYERKYNYVTFERSEKNSSFHKTGGHNNIGINFYLERNGKKQ